MYLHRCLKPWVLGYSRFLHLHVFLEIGTVGPLLSLFPSISISPVYIIPLKSQIGTTGPLYIFSCSSLMP